MACPKHKTHNYFCEDCTNNASLLAATMLTGVITCVNCRPDCAARLTGKKPYHVLPTEEMRGFKGKTASITKMGSICPSCGCSKPAKHI